MGLRFVVMSYEEAERKRKRYSFPLPTTTKGSAAASSTSAKHNQPGPLEQSQSHKRLRDTSPQWKEHFRKISDTWSSGDSFSQQKSNKIWESIRLEKEKGGYPWTHLSHNQDEEIWLNPQKLPPDIGR